MTLRISSRNASENPAGIETDDLRGIVVYKLDRRNASENPAGIETCNILFGGREVDVATHQKTQQGLKQSIG